jgi:hypothetical protein
MCELVRAAITKYHRSEGLNSRNLFRNLKVREVNMRRGSITSIKIS